MYIFHFSRRYMTNTTLSNLQWEGIQLAEVPNDLSKVRMDGY
jgi:hypothetical protein